MKTFIVHYTRLNERKDLADFQIAKNNLDAEFITEYDKDVLSEEIIDKFYEKHSSKYESKIEPLWDSNDFKYRELNMPEISCTIKHFQAIKKCAEAQGNYSLILEDDAVLNDTFAEQFEQNLSKTPKDWDAIFIGSGCGDWFQQHKLKDAKQVNDSCFLVKHPATNCAEGYLLKKDVAEKIYNNSIPFHLISDWELAYQLYNIDAKVYWWYPSLIDQGSKNGMFKSTLDLGQRG